MYVDEDEYMEAARSWDLIKGFVERVLGEIDPDTEIEECVNILEEFFMVP